MCFFRHLIDRCFAVLKWSRSWNDTENLCIRIGWISLICQWDACFLSESLFKKADYMSRAQSKQWSVQKDRGEREQTNLKLCLSCVGCPAHERRKNIGDGQQLSCLRGQHHHMHPWFTDNRRVCMRYVHENRSQYTCIIFYQAFFTYCSGGTKIIYI